MQFWCKEKQDKGKKQKASRYQTEKNRNNLLIVFKQNSDKRDVPTEANFRSQFWISQGS